MGLDRERCVLCARCTRFCDEISGDRFIELFERGAGERVSIAAGEDFASPFSGNTVQICPVGALTATPYRFVARPFDLSYGRLGLPALQRRLQPEGGRAARRGRAAARARQLRGERRLDLRQGPVRVPVPRRARPHHDAVDPRPRARARVVRRGARRRSRVDGRRARRRPDRRPPDGRGLLRAVEAGAHGLQDERPRPPAVGAARARPSATSAARPMSRDVRATSSARRRSWWSGLDAEQEVPILHLRLRKAARARRDGSGWSTRAGRGCTTSPTHVLVPPGRRGRAARPSGGAGARDFDEAVGGAPRGRRRGSWSSRGSALPGRARPRPRWRWPSTPAPASPTSRRRANDRGALRAGVHPALLPGGRTVDDEARRRWRPSGGRHQPRARPRRARHPRGLRGPRDRRAVPRSASTRCATFPDAALAQRALRTCRVKVVQSLELGSLEPFADAFLPAAAFLEKEGHVTDWEGRGQRIAPVRGAPGHRAARLGDLRGACARVRRRPGLRHASTSCTKRWARLLGAARGRAAPCRAPRADRPRPPDGGSALHLPAARGRGPSVGARRRAEGRARGTSRSSRCTPTTPSRSELSDGGRATLTRRPARPSCRCA